MRPQQTIVERLDFVAKRIPGLKFTPPTQLKPGDDQGYGCFMSCDMYYIEIKVDQSHQTVKDVVISHGNNSEGISCHVLRKVLQDQDFETFAKHLTGLHSIYQINTSDKKVKQKAYPALTALETDLTILYDHQRRRISNCRDIVHKSPIGIMEPRKGGLPVRLTYFITPYDLVDTNQKGLLNPSINNIIEKNLGLSATVEIEGSSQHKLQIKSLISTQHNSSLPAYAPFNSQNSEKLPAQFVLKLSQPLPMLNTSIQQIVNELNEPTTIKDYMTSLTNGSKESLISLIARQELDLNKGPFCRSFDVLKGADSDSCNLQKHVYSVKLLDQYHTYHILDNYLERQDGVYVTKIPFTHPTSIPNILRVLRQQALFNFVIGSCIRRNKNNNSNQTEDNTTKVVQESNIFDIIPVSLNNVCISFEHPSKESLATLEIDIRELSCHLYALDKESVCSNEYATTVLQKCWSIPITLRSVLKKCNERRLALLEDANKRRERELQELLTNNSTQQGLQYKPHLQYQETLLQSKFNNLNEKSNNHDLNSIAEFLSSNIKNGGSNETTNQANTNDENANNRSILLKKFSCKPKARQNNVATTKNQTGNKILSLMLKRPNSSTSTSDDVGLKATLTKKLKTKTTELSMRGSAGSTGLTTTKLITPEVANAARVANKQAKQSQGGQNVSLSLIRSPSKNQTNLLSGSSQIPVNVNLTSQVIASTSKQFDPPILNSSTTSNIRVKSQPNSLNNKPRKSSIGSVIDKLVGGVNPEQSQSNTALTNDNNIDLGNKNIDSSKVSPMSTKTKNRTSDQFAIKQGSLGSLKLTVTKTKPASTSSTLASMSSSSSSTTNSMNSSATSAAILSSSTTNTITSNNSSTTKSTEAAAANKILGLGSTTPTIKYTIPKISKTQQASQSGTSNQANSSETNQNSTTTTDSTSQVDESSNNPTSSGNASTASSTTTNKRTTPTPFNRSNTSNRNPVSSSTHPLGRTTSNPLANTSRPSSTTIGENHLTNRISSSNQNTQNIMRQQLNYRMTNAQQQSSQFQAIHQQQAMQRLVNPTTMNTAQFVSDSLQRPSPSVINAPPQFYMRQPMFNETPNIVSTTPRINNILVNNEVIHPTIQIEKKANDSTPGSSIIPMAMNYQPPRYNDPVVGNNPLLANMIGEMSSSTSNNIISNQTTPKTFGNQGVSSSSDTNARQDFGATISTPSSPTECSQIETIKPPPLIPIDSVEEQQPPSPMSDQPDDASDRLSIVDLNENIADSNSVAGTPKPSSVNSPANTQELSSANPSSSSSNAECSTAPTLTTDNNNINLGSTSEVVNLNKTINTESVASSKPLELELDYSNQASKSATSVQSVESEVTEIIQSTAPTSNIDSNENRINGRQPTEISQPQPQPQLSSTSSSSSSQPQAAAPSQQLIDDHISMPSQSTNTSTSIAASTTDMN